MAETKPSRKKGEYTLPNDLIRLHVALDWVEEEHTEILRKYGCLKRGSTITRDILVPKDMTLSALHFTLQRALGFQNSHLHCFRIYDDDLLKLTGDKMENLLHMRGIVFTQDRGPDVIVGPIFRRGSFKKWLKKQYTGPYRRYNDYIEEFNTLDGEEPDEERLLSYVTADDIYCSLTKVHEEEEEKPDFLAFKHPMVFHQRMLETFGADGKSAYYRWGEKESEWKSRLVPCGAGDEGAMKFEMKRLGDLSVRAGMQGLRYDDTPSYIIERLPLSNVLALSNDYLPYDDEGKMVHTVTGLKHPQEYTREEIQDALKKYKVLLPKPFTDMLIYNYDFGDNWHFRITGSKGVSDLVEAGVIRYEDLQKSIEKAQEERIPVLIAKDGDMLIEDVGNIFGFCRFLEHVKLKEDAVIKQDSDYYDFSCEDFFTPGYGVEDDEDEDWDEDEEEDWDEEDSDEASDFWDLVMDVPLDEYDEEEDEDVDENGMNRYEHLNWAYSQGWHRNDFKDIDLL